MKSEPDDVSINDLADMPNQTVGWFGVRNYQARNFMRDHMRVGDAVFFYHSSCPQPGIAGLARVVRLAYPDPTQFDPKSRFFDAKSSLDAPRWLQVDVQLVERWPLVSLAWLRGRPELAGMQLLQRGSRLSVMPIDPTHWIYIAAQRPQ